MKKNNKGFSLVELIIVIAIMAVLIGLLAPQYMRFVTRTKVTADVDNANSIARALDATIAESPIGAVNEDLTDKPAGTAVDTVINGVSELPESRYDKTYTWTINYDSNGVTSILLGGDEIYPGTDYYDNRYN